MELQEALLKLCSALNRHGAKYILVGGCAVILHGYYRTTHDIDLLVDPFPENIRKIKNALQDLFASEDVASLRNDDVQRYAVVRYVPETGEISVDLLKQVGATSYETASGDLEFIELEGVRIPLCGLATLIETKKGARPKDQEDLLFLLGKQDYLRKHPPR